MSLELHASLEQQQIVVDIMRELWKGHLIDDDAACEEAAKKQLPSPGDLRNKILVKVKYVPPQDPAKDAVKDTTKDESAITKTTSISSSNSDVEDDDDDEIEGINDGPVDAAPKKKKKKKVKILEALSRLGIYTRSYHFSSFTAPEASIPTHVFSLSEKALMSLHETHSPLLFAHNRRFLMRAYPKGLRVRSDNLDPAPFWRKGVQMVALNWQRIDEGVMLNEAMFGGTGGWVLKPPGYRSLTPPSSSLSSPSTTTTTTTTTPAAAPGQPSDINSASNQQEHAAPHLTLDLSLTIYAGQAIPLPPGDTNDRHFHPYVKVELHVEKASERTGAPIEGGGKVKDGEFKRKTKSVRGKDPDWAGEKVVFSDVTGVVEELAFLR